MWFFGNDNDDDDDDDDDTQEGESHDWTIDNGGIIDQAAGNLVAAGVGAAITYIVTRTRKDKDDDDD